MKKIFMKTNILEVYLGTVLGSIVSFVAPIMPFIYLTIGLIFADLYSGVRRAKAEGKKITSRGFYRTVEKTALYFFVIILSEGLAKVFLLPIPVTYIAAFTICLTEFKSLLENVTALTNVPFLEKLKELFEQKENKEESQEN
jgi:phage-related holin